MAPLDEIINSINNIETNLQNTTSSISQCTTIDAVKQLSWQLSSEISQLSKLKQDILDFESNFNQELTPINTSSVGVTSTLSDNNEVMEKL